MTITSQTKPIFIIGNPVNHSKSPIFQNSALQSCNISAVYLALDIKKQDFDTVISSLKKMEILGMNITIPYKVDIIKHIDVLSDDSQKIGAVNTIEIKDKKWIGHNTDWYGVYQTLINNKINNKSKVLIIGAGGATNGLIYGLNKYGIDDISITNRTYEKMVKIKELFHNIKIVKYENYKDKAQEFNFIINSTTLGFVDILDNYYKKCIYYDLKYYTDNKNIPNYIDGKDMLIYQGAKAFEIWTGITAPIDVMKHSLLS